MLKGNPPKNVKMNEMNCCLQNWIYMICRRETKSQPVADIFPFFWGGSKNLVTAIVLIGDKVVGKAIANRTRIRNEGKLGVWACS